MRYFLLCCVLAVFSYGSENTDTSNWQSQKVDLRGPAGNRIKEIRYPSDKPVPTLSSRKQRKHRKSQTYRLSSQQKQRLNKYTEKYEQSAPFTVSFIDSPPIDGFVPWIALAITDKREGEVDFEAVIHNQIVGNYPASNPDSGYAVAIFDTGASAHVIGYQNAIRTGLYTQAGFPKSQFITSNIVPISGVSGSVDALVSMPLGVFVDGLGAIDSDGLLTDRSAMVGQSNTAIIVGEEPWDTPDLATAIGSPLAVYFNTAIANDRQITIIRDSNQYTAPDIRLYPQDDADCPRYNNSIPLELRPLGGISVQYIMSLDPFNFDFVPASPSTIVGNSSQSLFFVHSVDLYHGTKSAIDKDRFMLDTGAQLTVIGKRVAARLAIDTTQPDFMVQVEGVTGDAIDVNGFYIDTIEIPALGQWLSYNNIPVIMLDIASPEGGTLDGIIGMNLFIDFNIVLRGGGLFLEGDPSLEFEPINFAAIADIAPNGGDGTINLLDLDKFSQCWLASPQSFNWDSICDLAPHPVRDGIVNFLDFAVLAEYWLESVAN
ncbi:MAG: retropepsin-like aspartic protease [Phycisphaerae bacterium]